MSATVRVRARARQDLEQAAGWYETRRRNIGLGHPSPRQLARVCDIHHRVIRSLNIRNRLPGDIAVVRAGAVLPGAGSPGRRVVETLVRERNPASTSRFMTERRSALGCSLELQRRPT